MPPQEFDYLMRIRGWTIFPAVVDPEFCERLRCDLREAYGERRRLQIANGIGGNTIGSAHHLVGRDGALHDLLEGFPLPDYIEQYFGGPFILNSYGASLNLDSGTSYLRNVHRDVRTYAGDFRLLLNVLVMLDDFTTDNGGTWVLDGSHHSASRPSDDLFWKLAKQITGSAGSIVFFDSNLWHCAGENRTGTPRLGLTLTWSRPFMKQQLDYPRYLGESFGNTATEPLRQWLGYNSRVPASLDEWYQPPEKRAYKSNQG